MRLILCILKDYRLVEDVLLGFVELGVTGATVVEGRGMGQIVGCEIPIFAALRGLFPGAAADSQIILAAVQNDLAQPCFDLIEKVAGPLNAPGAGVVFSLPIEAAAGLANEIT